MYITKSFGFKPSLPDHNHPRFENHFDVETLSTSKTQHMLSLETAMPPVYDQGELGSCTANALAAAFEYDQIKEKYPDFMGSRLFIYYYERSLEGTVSTDSGAAISDGIKVLNTYGVCHESIWPYDITQFAVQPSAEADTDSALHKSVKYYKVPMTVSGFKAAIVSGFGVVFGFSVPQSFMTQQMANTGIMTPPTLGDKIVGGHAVLACGFNDTMTHNGTTGFLLVRNSWGPNWGQQGYFWFPYECLTMLGSDAWVVNSVFDESV